MEQQRRRALVAFSGMCAASVLGAASMPRRRPAAVSDAELDTLVPDRFADWQIDGLPAAFVRPGKDLPEWGYQKLVERTYVDRDGRRVMLSLAHGGDQAAGLELHLPEVCYRYAGFSVSGRHVAELAIQDRRLVVTRLLADLPQRPEVVTYWIVLGGEAIADRNTFRLRRLAHAVRRTAADGMLVRVSSLDLDAERAFALQAKFVNDMLQAVEGGRKELLIGRRVTGQHG